MAYIIFFGAVVLISSATDITGRTSIISLIVGLLVIPVIVPIAVILRSTLISGQFYGLLWADQISQLLLRERKNNTYDLLALFPPGLLAMSWAICTGCLYQRRRFNNLLEFRTVMMRTIAFTGILMLIFMVSYHEPAEHVIRVAALTGLLMVALHFDFVHSLTLSTLISLLIPRYSLSSLDVRLWTVGGILFAQVSAYTAMILVASVIAPSLLAQSGLAGWIADTVRWLLAVLVLYGLREGLIMGLWRWLLHLANTESNELNNVFRFPAPLT